MASANDSKALEAGTYSYLDGADLSNEKLAIEDFRTKDNITPEAPRTTLKFNKMASLRYLFMTLALLSVFIVSLSSAAAVRPKDCHSQTAQEIKFQELLATVSDDDLHKILEEHVSSKYKPGVWREGRTAMSAVHKDDAAKATSLIQLARRQNVSMTTDAETATPSETTIVVPPTNTDAEPSTTADPEPTTSDEPTPSETTTEPTQDPTVSETFSDIPPVISSTALPTKTVTETESSITEAEPSQTSEPPVSSETQEPETSQTTEETTTSNTDAPSTSQTSVEPTAITTSPNESITPTSEPTTTVTSTEADSTRTTVQTTTMRSSSMTTSRATTARSTTSDEATTTSEEIESSTTQEVVFTTVKPDGSRSTITSYTIVPAAEATQDAPADPTFTPEVQDAATGLRGTGILGFAIVSLTALMAAL